MLSTASVTAFGASAVMTFVVPIVFLIVLCAKKKSARRPVLVGILAFAFAQIVLRLPLLSLLGQASWMQQFRSHQDLYAILIGGLSAGLFEESARLLGAKYLLKGQQTSSGALSFGLGHAFCELILLTGLTNLNYFIYALMAAGGKFEQLTAAMPALTAQTILTVLRGTAPLTVYLSLLERFSAVLFHLFASTLIFYGVAQKKSGRFYLLALLAHTAFNACGSLVLRHWNLYAAEAVLLLLALAGGAVIAWMRRLPWEARKMETACAVSQNPV